MGMLESVKILLEENSAIFLVLFVISLAANIFEITGFFGERSKRKLEQERREKDEERLRVYEYLFETAQQSISTEEELGRLREEVARRKDVIPKLEARIDLLHLAAKKEIASQNMSRTVADLRAGLSELEKLREMHGEFDDLPDLPQGERQSIEREIASTTLRPYELPKSVTYRALILVLVVFLLPTPVDLILIVILLRIFMTTFFEVAALSREPELSYWVFEHQRAIGFLSCYGAWFVMLSTTEHLMGQPLDILMDAVSSALRESVFGRNWLGDLLARRTYLLEHLLVLFASFLFSRVHWKRIRDAVLSITPPEDWRRPIATEDAG